LFTVPLCPACAFTFRMTFSSSSVTMYMPQRALNGGFPSTNLQNFALFSWALFTIVVHWELSPTLAGVHLARISMSLSTLCTCCTTESASGYLFVMAWHWDFSDDSSCLQYFWNPSSGTLVSRWLPTAAARVQTRVWSSGICGGQSGAGAGFLRVVRFPLPIFIPPNSPST
jgi:hypothetical protein